MAKAFGLPGNRGAKKHYWFMMGYIKGDLGEQTNKKVMDGLSEANREAYLEGWEKGSLALEERQAKAEFEHGFNNF